MLDEEERPYVEKCKIGTWWSNQYVPDSSRHIFDINYTFIYGLFVLDQFVC